MNPVHVHVVEMCMYVCDSLENPVHVMCMYVIAWRHDESCTCACMQVVQLCFMSYWPARRSTLYLQQPGDM